MPLSTQSSGHGAPAPGHVSILGLGPSLSVYVDYAKRLGGRRAYCDETWGINAAGDVIACDRVFHMDDVRVQEGRAALKPEGNIAAMLPWLRKHPGPVYTSQPHPGYPGLVPFPLEDVLNARLDGQAVPYFNTTAAYAIVYAIFLGVKRISLFGMDFTLAHAHSAERGRACCEYWLGVAGTRGIEITVPDTSTLLDACAPERELLYGYDCLDVTLAPEGERVRVAMAERKDMPSAAEIERRYDHTRHPNRLMQGEKPCEPR